MTKQDSVSAGLSAIQQGQTDALGKCYDDGVASVVVPPVAGFQQSDIDAAVAAASATLQGHVDDLQKIVDQDNLDKQALQAKLDQIKALLA